MTEDIWHQILKEWYWLVIFAALVAVAFAPSFLKGKCPACKKCALSSAEFDESVAAKLREDGLPPFTSFYECQRCKGRFKRIRTGPFEDASNVQYEAVFSGK